MIVEKEQLSEVIALLNKPGSILAVDTETTGLRWFDRHRLFSIIIADVTQAYYFNFNPNSFYSSGDEVEDRYILDYSDIDQLKPIFSHESSTWFMHNAKFDMGMLAKEGIRPAGNIHCTEAVARLIFSGHDSYALKMCLKRMNQDLKRTVIEKSDKAMEYIRKNNLKTSYNVRGKKKSITDLHFDKVPLDIIAPYGEIDAVATRKLGLYQIEKLRNLKKVSPKIGELYETEKKITKILFDSELEGFPLDIDKTNELFAKDEKTVKAASSDFEAHTGLKFMDSHILLTEAFDSLKIDYPLTDKGNPSFDKKALKEVEHPVASSILEIRGANKRISSYFSNFLMYASDIDQKIHCNYRQGGTATGRMSVWNPAMQTIPTLKEDLEEQDDLAEAKLVRSCFTPRHGECLFMPDYDQMEYRMMLDQAEEHGVIKLIKEGLDVHTATAELVGVSRSDAKTINFMLLYGGGAQKLADALGVTLAESKAIKRKYFAKLPNVQKWINFKIKHLEHSVTRNPSLGYNVNPLGRVTFLNKNLAFKTPNYDIQGGCADVVKKAIVEIYQYFENFKLKSKMLLQVHDELIFSIPKDELIHTEMIVSILENAYKYKYLQLTAGASYSWTDWGNKVEGYPQIGKATGVIIQGKGF